MLTDRVTVWLQVYRPRDDRLYDSVAHLTTGDHLGEGRYRAYAAASHRLPRPGGRLLPHPVIEAEPAREAVPSS
ncbi:cyclopropane fatty-acyl-phospholipid synthase-like methyltransferase [Actinoalloteichus hoggarensis]|uniref:Uncharacterized protein n=1 Tax=Actinoalloteichus hoggarensis TaxID=1470176 RepID=A0A221W7F3_9PSEU|nr:hypothetical protein AHOG_21470 [Actinoalloteichus hoggarensis]MBB5924539.1 cyclopropane fatty-acyl-phospholipid synthase-like methyltransferase [Actinoalloteichus hoggarensis]